MKAVDIHNYIFKELNENPHKHFFIDLQLHLIVYILCKYSFRISEVLNLHRYDLMKPDVIRFIISKSKHHIIIHDEFLYNHLLITVNKETKKCFSVNYRAVHSFISKNYDFSIIRNLSKNRRITHAFRYHNAERFKAYFNSTETTQNILHHKSQNSQKYYLRKKK